MERHCDKRNHSGSFWAYVLIIAGILWLMKQSGWDFNLPGIGGLFSGIGNFISHFTHWISSAALLPVLVIFIGILLIAGRKVLGAFFLVLLLLIIVPHVLIIPGILMIVFFPIMLILIGIVILTKFF